MISGEALFCTVMEAEYNAFVAIIENIIFLPQTALSIVKSLLQAANKLAWELIRSGIVALEQLLIGALNFDGFDLSTMKDNFCQVLWDCAFMKNTLLEWLGVDGEDKIKVPGYPRQTVTYPMFEDLICKQGLRSFAEDFIQTEVLNNMATELTKIDAKIDEVYNKANKEVIDFTDRQLKKKLFGTGKSFEDLMVELDKFAQCAFATCNFALTSSNKKDDLLDGLGVTWSQSEARFEFVLDEWIEFKNERGDLKEYVNILRRKLATNTPQRGVQPDEISRN